MYVELHYTEYLPFMSGVCLKVWMEKFLLLGKGPMFYTWVARINRRTHLLSHCC